MSHPRGRALQPAHPPALVHPPASLGRARRLESGSHRVRYQEPLRIRRLLNPGLSDRGVKCTVTAHRDGPALVALRFRLR